MLGAGLLVGGDHDQQLARSRSPALARQRHGGGDLGGHLALHVHRAAAPDAAVADLARPRVHLPVGGVGQHRVHVAQQAQGRPVGRPGQPRDQVRPPLDLGQQLDLEARALEQVAQELLGGLLVAGRVDRVEPDQALQELGGVTLQIGGLGHPAMVSARRLVPLTCTAWPWRPCRRDARDAPHLRGRPGAAGRAAARRRPGGRRRRGAGGARPRGGAGHGGPGRRRRRLRRPGRPGGRPGHPRGRAAGALADALVPAGQPGRGQRAHPPAAGARVGQRRRAPGRIGGRRDHAAGGRGHHRRSSWASCWSRPRCGWC